MDYTLILCLAILAFYLLDLLLLLPAGEGIAIWPDTVAQARRSWRARLGGRFALLAAPWRLPPLRCSACGRPAPRRPGALARGRRNATAASTAGPRPGWR